MSANSAAKFSVAFLERLQAAPEAEIAAIVRCDRLETSHIAEAEAAGLSVTRRLRLIRGLAVQGPAAALLDLAGAAWVVRIEPDQPVHTQRQGTAP